MVGSNDEQLAVRQIDFAFVPGAEAWSFAALQLPFCPTPIPAFGELVLRVRFIRLIRRISTQMLLAAAAPPQNFESELCVLWRAIGDSEGALRWRAI